MPARNPAPIGVPLDSVLTANDLLPTDWLVDADYLTSAGTVVRLLDHQLAFGTPGSYNAYLVERWDEARSAWRRGDRPGLVAFIYPSGQNRRFRVEDVRVSLSYLGLPRIEPGNLPGVPVLRRLERDPDGSLLFLPDRVRLTSLGVRSAHGPGMRYRTEWLYVVPEPELRALESGSLTQSVAALDEWWARQHRLDAVLARLRGQTPTGSASG